MFYLLAFISGIIITIQLTINSELTKKIGMIKATFSNFLLAVCILLVLSFFMKNSLNFDSMKNVPLFYYLGGALAISVTLASNFLIPKLPLIYNTIFVFVGQMCGGLTLDYLGGYTFGIVKILGFICVTTGILSLIYMDYKKEGE